jgi:outer membrane protein TolC
MGTAVVSAPVAGQQSAPAAPMPQVAAPAGPVLPLTMEQAVQMALENNLGLKAGRLAPESAALGIAAARASFLPVVQTSLSRNSARSQAIRLPDGTETVPSSTRFAGGADYLQALPWYGGNFRVSWSGDRRASAGTSATFNPQLGSTFNVAFTQPLWQDFRIDSARANLERAERQKVIVDLQLEQRIVATDTTVRAAYLNLLARIEGLKVAEQNMEIAETSLRNARAKVKVGQAPEIEIVTAEAAVENNRDSVIQSGAAIATAEDNLRSLILSPDQPDYWTVRIQPTDTIQVQQQEINLEAAVANALANRLDMVEIKRQMEITDLNLELSRNLTKPAVDFNVNYVASGSGGNQLEDGIVVLTRGFGGVLGDAFGGAYPSWTVGVNVQYPLGRSAAEASLAQNEITKRQQELQRRELEFAIIQEVRQAARDVQTSYQRVQAARAFRAAADRQLEAENQKMEVGLSNTFDLQLRQRDAAQARISELNAMISYNNALIQFQRVQKIQ